jgi:hypothetical protein
VGGHEIITLIKPTLKSKSTLKNIVDAVLVLLPGMRRGGGRVFLGAPVNKNLPLFLCLLIRN